MLLTFLPIESFKENKDRVKKRGTHKGKDQKMLLTLNFKIR